MIQPVHLVLGLQQLADVAFKSLREGMRGVVLMQLQATNTNRACLGDVVHVLRLDDALGAVLQQFREVVLRGGGGEAQ